MNARITRRAALATFGALVLGGALAGATFAQETAPVRPGPGYGPAQRGEPGPCHGGAGGPGPVGQPGTVHEAIAGALGMTSQELFAARQAGKTIAQLAAERGVPLDNVVAAALAAHKQWLDAQVQAGRLPQAQADQMRARMEAHLRASFEGQVGPGRGPGYGPRWQTQ